MGISTPSHRSASRVVWTVTLLCPELQFVPSLIHHFLSAFCLVYNPTIELLPPTRVEDNLKKSSWDFFSILIDLYSLNPTIHESS